MAQQKDFPTQYRGTSGPGYQQSQRGQGVEDVGRMPRQPKGAGNRESASDPMGEGMNAVGQVISRHPYPSLLTSFGLGFGFGLAVTFLIYHREPSWFERNISEPLQHFPDRLKHVPEAIGSHLPSSWRR